MGCSVSTAVRQAASRTVRSACLWPMPVSMAGCSWTGNCTCPRGGRRIGSGAGRPECQRGVSLRTKPRLAQPMLEQAVESEIPFAWVAGDEVYGSDRNLRLWLEREGVPHVLAVKRSEKLWTLTDRGPRQVRVDRLVSGVEECAWVRCSAEEEAKGARVYDWTAVDIRPLREPEKDFWLLLPRSLCPTRGTGLLRLLWPEWTSLEELRGWPGPGGP